MDKERPEVKEKACVTNAPNVLIQGVDIGTLCSNVDRHKKKVTRRRLQTKRPYQERLLNMAEARKEIVTALKFHRATMKQQKQEAEQNPSTGCHHTSYGFGLPTQLPLGLSLNFHDFSYFIPKQTLFASPSSSTEEAHSAGLMSEFREMKRVESLENCYDTEFEISKDEELFKELTEIPSWLNPKDLTITFPTDSSPDPELPRLDIGEIEGMDGDYWLA